MSVPLQAKQTRIQPESAAGSAARSYFGLVGLQGSQVIRLNGSANAVGKKFRLPSGAFVTVKTEGAWVYEPPKALTSMPAGQRALDCFVCEVHTDGETARETVTVALENRAARVQLVDGDRQPAAGDDSSTAPFRMLIAASTQCETTIDLRPISGLEPDSKPAVLVLEQPLHGNASVTGTGEIVFRPEGDFTGLTKLRCLTENKNRSATFVVVHIDVQPPVRFHSSSTSPPKTPVV